MRILLHSKASAELEDAFVWYKAKAEDLGAEFLDEIDGAIAATRDASSGDSPRLP